jgi:uncharacterized protein (DUF2267 family)/quercetin dioxygenase-like cupin family protein
MGRAEVKGFESTLRKTHGWLAELSEALGFGSHQRAYQVLRATLHALRDRLTPEEAAQFAAQLPMLVRGFFYEGWHPTGKPVKTHRAECLAAIEDVLTPGGDVNAERAVRSVFRLIAAHVSPGEVEDVKRVLPEDLRDLWPTNPVQVAREHAFERPYLPVDLDKSPFEPLPVTTMLEQLMTEKTFSQAGRNALTMLSSKGLRVVLTVARAGSRCDQHEAPGAALLFDLRGRLAVTAAAANGGAAAPIELEEGTALLLAPHLRHDIGAGTDCAFLLVIGGNP